MSFSNKKVNGHDQMTICFLFVSLSTIYTWNGHLVMTICKVHGAKCIVEGQVVIVREGVMYNMFGQKIQWR